MINILMIWIYLCAVIYGSIASASPNTITVDDTCSNIIENCAFLKHYHRYLHCTFPCLEVALNQMQSNTILNITVPYTSLTSHVELIDLHNITIIGSNSEITCSASGSLMFRNCSNVIIENITWSHCGQCISHVLPLGINSLKQFFNLRFHFGSNLTIQRCSFIQSYVEVYQVTRYVAFSKVFFSDEAKQQDCFSFGGLFLKYFEHVASTTVIITDSTFADTKPNGLGGQIFEVEALSANINLTIANSMFSNNSYDYYKKSLVTITLHVTDYLFAKIFFINVTFKSNNLFDKSVLLVDSNCDTHLLSCWFLNNTATNVSFFNVTSLQLQKSTFQHNSGKFTVVSATYSIIKGSSNNRLRIVSLTFNNNVGGPLISVRKFYKIKLQKLEFMNNVLLSGHGLVVVLDYHHLNIVVSNINIKFNKLPTNGRSFYCSSSASNFLKPPSYMNRIIPQHKLLILNAKFLHNRGGGHGAGVYISHPICDYCPVVGSYTIENCKFDNNTNINSVVYYSGSNYSHYTTDVTIKHCKFTSNGGTAIWAVNSNLVFDKGVTLFEKNTAEHGAALYLDLNSKLTFATQSEVIFNNNRAIRYGGVIYCNVLPNNNCYRNLNNIFKVMSTNTTNIQFSDNAAVIEGSSVFFSISPLCDDVFQSELNITEHVFGEQIITSPVKLRLEHPAYLIANDREVEGFGSANYSKVGGSGTDLVNILEYPTYTISNIMFGQEIVIPVCVVDYNGKPAGPISFSVVPISGYGNYFIEGDIIYSLSCIPEQGINNLQVTGKESIRGTSPPTIIVQFHSLYDTAYTWTPLVVNLRVELSSCHSGFQYDNSLEKCACYNRDEIVECSGSSANIRRGYWFGVVNKQTTVGICPVNYCNLRNCESTTTFCPLLSSSDTQCEEHRLGIACGECEDGYTLSFDSVECISTSKCTTAQTVIVITMTFLYWIVTIVLVFVIMYFKIGIWNFYSITFYYSVTDILLGPVLHSSDTLYRMVIIVSSLARLTPQFLGELCFVRGLSGIDQQFIHYVHPLAVLVILLLISISVKFSRRLSLFVSRGIIHVICFLLLLSYASIASTSLLLMRPLTFTGVNKVFTYLSPDLGYFTGRHLVYGLAAIVCGLVIAIGLPLLLLIEPFLNHKINFTRIKPLLDQFQGCYKDKYRCFASYYMICRLVLLIIVNINVSNIFTTAYIQLAALVVMALIHFTFRPYTSKTLNTVDGLVLLAMILMTALQPFEAANGFATKYVIGLASAFLVLPLFVLIVPIAPFIKQFTSFCLSTILKSRKVSEDRHGSTEIPNDESEVTVDRRNIPTTIVGPLQHEPRPVSFQESLLALGID